MRPAGWFYRHGVVGTAKSANTTAPAAVGAGPARPGLMATGIDAPLRQYSIGPPVVTPAPYDIAAIDYDPRDEGLTPQVAAVQDEIYRITEEIRSEFDGKFDSTSRQVIAIILHARLAEALRDRIPGVTVEETIAPDGEISRYGLDGAKRTDVGQYQLRHRCQRRAHRRYGVGGPPYRHGETENRNRSRHSAQSFRGRGFNRLAQPRRPWPDLVSSVSRVPES